MATNLGRWRKVETSMRNLQFRWRRGGVAGSARLPVLTSGADFQFTEMGIVGEWFGVECTSTPLTKSQNMSSPLEYITLLIDD